MRVMRLLLCLAPVALMGCYTYVYTPVTPVPGMRLSLGLNDIGRAELMNNIGPEVASVEGTLVSTTDSEYVLRVSRTIGFRGQVHPWNGELVTLRTSQVGLLRERRFAAGQTVALASSLAASFVAFVVTRSVIGGGSSAGGAGEPPPVNGQ